MTCSAYPSGAALCLPDGSVKIFCKGADNVIFERLSEENQLSKEALSPLEIFAGDGLRTLCIALLIFQMQTMIFGIKNSMLLVHHWQIETKIFKMLQN